MDEDPVFYKKLSELIQQTISDLRASRISEIAALKKLKEYREQAITKKGDDIPVGLQEKEEAIAFYRLIVSATKLNPDQCEAFANETDAIIKEHVIVDWTHKLDVLRKVNFYIGEYLIDELKMPIDEAEILAEKCIEIAKIRYQA